MRALSIVIPAYNEAQNIEKVVRSIPVEPLRALGWSTEVIIVDNASTDGTGDIARRAGAEVVHQGLRGYGNAYKAGIAAATGEVVATGDADCTYPFDLLPELLATFQALQIDFLTTNRLQRVHDVAMKPSHSVGNHVLSAASRCLFGNGIRDSQSGMWIFYRSIWEELGVRSGGMAFSQEIKNSAGVAGFRFGEVSIPYRQREGEVKLNAFSDGIRNLSQLVAHRLRPGTWHLDRPRRMTPNRPVPGYDRFAAVERWSWFGSNHVTDLHAGVNQAKVREPSGAA